jgi:hypothetical protein
MPVRLMPAAIVSGEVLDEFNDPVPDVEIRVLAIQMKLGQMYLRVAGKAITDDRGQYRVPGLHPGKYYVVAEYKMNNETLEALKSMIAEKLLERSQGNASQSEELLLMPRRSLGSRLILTLRYFIRPPATFSRRKRYG